MPPNIIGRTYKKIKKVLQKEMSAGYQLSYRPLSKKTLEIIILLIIIIIVIIIIYKYSKHSALKEFLVRNHIYSVPEAIDI